MNDQLKVNPKTRFSIINLGIFLPDSLYMNNWLKIFEAFTINESLQQSLKIILATGNFLGYQEMIEELQSKGYSNLKMRRRRLMS